MIGESMLREFDVEMANTRRVLERLPADRFDWQPHAKSMTLGRLAGHLATLPEWGTMAIEREGYDVLGYVQEQFATTEELVARFDELVGGLRPQLAAVDDAIWEQPWTLSAGEQVIFAMPRIDVLRLYTFNHMIHHRAQLTVYLRLNDIAVPGLYGPSADEQ